MIINNKINKLTDVYEITDNKMKFLKVKLMILNQIIIIIHFKKMIFIQYQTILG